MSKRAHQAIETLARQADLREITPEYVSLALGGMGTMPLDE